MRSASVVLFFIACGPVSHYEPMPAPSTKPTTSTPAAAAAAPKAASLSAVERCIVGQWSDQSRADTTLSYTYNADHTYRTSMVYSPIIGTPGSYDKSGKWQLSGDKMVIDFDNGEHSSNDLALFRTLNPPKDRDSGCDHTAFKALVGEDDPSEKPYLSYAPHKCWYAAMKGPTYEVRLTCDAEGNCVCAYKQGTIAEYHVSPSCTGGNFTSTDVAWKQCYKAAIP